VRGVRVRVRVSAATATAAACNVRGVRGRGRRADFRFVRKFFLILTSLLKNLNLRLRRPRGGAGLPPLAPPRRRRQHRHGKIPRAQSHPESHPETHPKPVLISEIKEKNQKPKLSNSLNRSLRSTHTQDLLPTTQPHHTHEPTHAHPQEEE
jgi:hypothetical protein